MKFSTISFSCHFVAALFTVLSTLGLQAQDTYNTYLFSSSSGSYTAITGGTVYQSGTTINTNAVSSAITLPFTFTFRGTAYTSCYISNNGFITFGASAPSTTTYNPIALTGTVEGVVCGYGFNLVASAVSGAAPEIRYQTVGSSPNQEFVVQFTDVARTTITGDRMNFQIWLSEGGTIRIVFGAWAASSTTTLASNFGVCGLRGSSNADFHHRMVYATAPYNTWASSGAAGDNGATLRQVATDATGGVNCMRYNNAYLPASGLTYTWTRIGSSFYQSLPYTQNFDSWTSLQSVNDVPASSGVTNWPAAGHRTFRNITETVANAAWNGTTGRFTAPTTQAGAGSAEFNQYNAPSASLGHLDFYLNFSLAGNKDLSFYVRNPGTANANDVVRVFLSTDGGATFTQQGADIAAPQGAWTQVTRALGTSTSTNCILRIQAVSDYGSTAQNLAIDELSVTVPSCAAPTAVSGTPTSPTAANLAWTEPGTPPSGGYEWEVRTSGLGGSGATGLTASGTTAAGVTTASTSALSAATTYTLYVRSNCGGSGFSTWAASGTFVTPCATVISFPYTMGFDGSAPCWTVSGGTAPWALGASSSDISASQSGSGFAYKPYNTSTQFLFSPPFDLASFGSNAAELNFWIWRQSGTVAADSITFKYNTSASNTGATRLTAYPILTTSSPSVASSGWYNYSITLPTGLNSAGTIYFVVQGATTAGFSSYDIGLDNFVVQAAPTCFPPTGLNAVATSATSVNLSWVAPLIGTPASYDWEVRTSGLPGTGGSIASGTTATLAATTSALTANTNYSFYVRTSCTGPTSNSTWAGPFNFVTPCVAVNVTYTQDFSTAVPPAAPACNAIENTNGDVRTWRTIASLGGVAAVSSSAIGYQYNTDLVTPANDWFFTQGINLTAGTTYRLRFRYLCSNALFVEALRVRLATAQSSASVLGGAPLFENSNINLNTYTTASLTFTVPSTGVYYVGFQAFSDADKDWLVLDDIIVDLAPALDMSATALVSPSGCVNATSAVTIRVKNNGAATINFATNNVGVNVNVSGPNPATLSATLNSGTLAVGATLDVVVDAAFNTSAVGTYTFAASTALIGDGDLSNDAMPTASVTRTLPIALPQTANFTGFTGANLTTVFPNWREAEGPVIPVGTTSNWLNRTLGGGTTAAVNLSSIFTTSWMIGPKFTATTCSEVKFRAAITDFASTSPDPTGMTGTDDKVEVMISTDCGLTWSPIYTFNSANQPTSTLTNYSVDLSAYSGQDIVIAFKATDGPIDNTPDYDFHIDDINIQNKPASDAGVVALVAPASPDFCGTANQAVTVRLKNYGCATLTSIPVSVSVTGAVTQTLTATYSGSLASNAEVNFNVGTLDMTAGGTYTFAPTTTLGSDGDATNNAITSVAIGTLNPTSLVITPSLSSVCSPTPFSLTAVATGTPQTVLSGTSGSVNLAIPDNTPAGVTSTITISGGLASTLTASDVIRVTLNINHEWLADVDVYLVDPSGTRAMELTSDNGPSGLGAYTNTQLLTSATPSITTGSTPFTGVFSPEGNLSTGVTFNSTTYTALNGSSYNGAWTLVVVDDGNIDVGTLVSWSLEITSPTNYTHAFSGLGTLGATTYSGLFNSTGTVGVTAAPVGTNTYTVTTTGTNGCVTTKTASVTVSNCPANTWQGDVTGDQTNWFNAANWSGNVVPTCGTPAIIPTNPSGGAFFPFITGADASVGNITVQNNASIAIDNNRTLSVCGNFVGGTSALASINGLGKAVLVQSGGLQTISGRVRFETLRVQNTLSGSSQITGGNTQINTVLELGSGNLNIANAASLTLLSTSVTHAANINDFGSNAGTLTGNVVAQRYVGGSGNLQHQVGSPVSANLNQFGSTGGTAFVVPLNCDETQLDFSSPYGKVFEWHENVPTSCILEGWQVKGSASPADAAKGYSVYLNGGSTLNVTGAPNLATSYSQSGTRGGYNLPTLQSSGVYTFDAGWNLFSNPFPSGYTYTAQAGYNANGFIYVPTGPFSGTYQQLTPNTVLAPFQGIMLQKSNPGGSANYTFSKANRTLSGTTTFFQNSNAETLEVEVSGNGFMDKTQLSFISNSTDQFDTEFDLRKQRSNLGQPTIFTGDNTFPYAMNSKTGIAQTSTVDMGLIPGANGTYTFTVNGISSFDPTSYIYLEDKVTGTYQNLRDNNSYAFSMNNTENVNRFVLHFTPKAEIQAANATCQNNGQITIEQPGAANWNYTITDNATNATMAQGMLNSSNPIAVAAPTGVYNITLTDNNGYQVIKNVQVNGQTPIAATMSANTNTAEVDEIITLNNTTTGATNQTWDMGNSVQFSTPMVNYSYPSEGVYTVTLSTINADGCNATTTQTITVTQKTATSLNNLTKDKLRVWSYENNVMVDFTKQPGDAVVIIYNLLGQEISNEPYTGNGIYSKELNNNELGYILIKVRQGDKVTTKKLFINQM